MGWLIALGSLLLLAAVLLIPVGLRIGYDREQFTVRIRVAGISFPYRKKKKEPLRQQPAEKPRQTANPSEEKQKSKPEGGKPRLPTRNRRWEDYWPLVRLGMELLGDLRRRLRVDRLELHMILAGEDPCDLAVNYGRISAVISGLMPQLDRLLIIRRQDIRLECDFAAEKTKITGLVELHLTVGRALCLAAGYGLRFMRELITRKRKGGALL